MENTMSGFANDPAAIKAAQIEKAGELPAAQARETENVFALSAGVTNLQTQMANLLGALHTARLTQDQQTRLDAVGAAVDTLGLHVGKIVSELPHHAVALPRYPISRSQGRDFFDTPPAGAGVGGLTTAKIGG
jgi:hypothetical protein